MATPRRRPKVGGDQQDGERLHRDVDRSEHHLGLGRQGQQQRSGDGQEKLRRQSRRALLRQSQRNKRAHRRCNCHGLPHPVCRDPMIAVSVFVYWLPCYAAIGFAVPGTMCTTWLSNSIPASIPHYGQGVSVAPDVQRVTANNPSPFTFHGTNSYVVGRDTLAVIDPGPDDEAHLQTLLKAIAGRPVSHIFVSHTHRDHSPLAARLKEHTGAVGAGRRPAPPCPAAAVSARPIRSTPAPTPHFVPDIAAADGALIAGDGWAIRDGSDARPHRQPCRLRAGRNRHPVFGRPCHGVVDHRSSRRRTAPWPTTWPRWTGCSSATTGSVARPWRAGDGAARFHARAEDPSQDARARHPGAGPAGDRTIADMVKAIYRDTDPAAAWRGRAVGACPSRGSGGARPGHRQTPRRHRRHFHAGR